MNLRNRIPVEPLDDERVVKIERAIVSSLPARAPRPSRWRLAVPIVLAAAAAAGALLLWRSAAHTARHASTAPVEVTAAPDGTKVDIGDAQITTSAGASFVVTRPEDGVSIELTAGTIELEVAPRKDRGPLVVHAADVDVVVVGTHFTVALIPPDDVEVSVLHGIVRVIHGTEVVTLAAGQSWSRNGKVAMADPVPVPHAALDTPVPDPVSEPKPHKPSTKPPKPPTVDDPLGDLRRDIIAVHLEPPTEGGDADDQMYVNARGKDAIRYADIYITRFPAGRHLDDVLFLRIKEHCKTAFDDKCRAAAHTYLTKIGATGRRGELAERVTHVH